MSDLVAFGQVVLIWLVVSVSLWGVHRFWVRRKERLALAHAARAAALAREAKAVFAAIRTLEDISPSPRDPKDWLRAQTFSLLARIQTQSDFFDALNAQRVQMQAALNINDHQGLSDILHIRRDLWAASEIILVDDPAQFGSTFRGEGALERFQTEAAATLFGRSGDQAEDVVGLRLSLAVQAAEDFEAELAQSIADRRERDRLPTASELAGYPVRWLRAVPLLVLRLWEFARAFVAQALFLSRRIGGSRTLERGRSRMRQIGEEWPQQLSESFQRASQSARANAAALRTHYDFLVTAYDFRAKYEQLVKTTPKLNERARQFITRLELAEKSERLRLTSATIAVWIVQKSVRALAHAMALGWRIYADVQQTRIWTLASLLVAPSQDTGRRPSAFRSFNMAMAAGGIMVDAAPRHEGIAAAALPERREARKSAAKPVRRNRPAVGPEAAPAKTSMRDPMLAAQTGAGRAAAAATPEVKLSKKTPKIDVTASREEKKVEKQGKTAEPKTKHLDASASGSGRATASKTRKAVKAAAEAPSMQAVSPAAKAAPSDPAPSPAPKDRGIFARLFRKRASASPMAENAPVGESSGAVVPAEQEASAKQPESAPKPEISAAKKPKTRRKRSTSTETPRLAKANELAAKPERVTEIDRRAADKKKGNATALPATEDFSPTPAGQPKEDGNDQGGGTGFDLEPERKQRSLFARLFGRKKTDTAASDDPAPLDWPVMDVEIEGDSSTDRDQSGTPLPPPPSLMQKLSSIQLDLADQADNGDDAAASGEKADDAVTDTNSSEADELGPLTKSLMELEKNMKPPPPQIRAFPWLRG